MTDKKTHTSIFSAKNHQNLSCSAISDNCIPSYISEIIKFSMFARSGSSQIYLAAKQSNCWKLKFIYSLCLKFCFVEFKPTQIKVDYITLLISK